MDPRAPAGVSDASGVRQRARGIDPPPEAGKLAFVLSTFGPLPESPRAQYDGAAPAANVPGTCEGWLPGPRKVWQLLWAFGRGLGVSIPHQRRGNWPLFRQLLILWVYRPGHKRRGGGCFKPTWYVCGGSPGPRKVRQMLQAFSGGNVPSIPH